MTTVTLVPPVTQEALFRLCSRHQKHYKKQEALSVAVLPNTTVEYCGWTPRKLAMNFALRVLFTAELLPLRTWRTNSQNQN